MDYREESFRRKFSSAAEQLSAKPEQVISLKIRENVGSYDEYRELVRVLKHEAGLQCSTIEADLQGHGYLVADEKTKVIIVQHESGLELLYIAGSIASLIGIVPLVLHAWRALRGHMPGRHNMPDHGVEMRRIDSSGCLREEVLHNRPSGFLPGGSWLLPALSTTARLVEQEIANIRQDLEKLSVRVDRLENHRHSKGRLPAKKKKPVPPTTPRKKEAK